MKNDKLFMRKKGITFGIALISLILFSTCQDAFDPADYLIPIENSYGRVSVSITGEESSPQMSRSVLPPNVFDRYEYTFTRSGGTAIKINPDNGYFTLEVGDYTVKVDAYIGTTLVASGVSSQFNVGTGINTPVEVRLSEISGGQGTFIYTITYPAGAEAEITLQKWPGLNDITLTPVTQGDGKNQTLQLDAGSYLLTVHVNKNGLYGGVTEAIHIYPSLPTTYSKNFTDDDLLDNLIIVTKTDEWDDALNRIRNGGNDHRYIITVSGNVPVHGSTENSFGTVSGVTVTLKGNGKLNLTSQGNLLKIGSSQTVYIDSANLTLEGLKSGQNGSSQDNNTSLVVNLGILELRNGIICGNTNTPITYTTGSGGVANGDGGTFIMSGGTISGNTATSGGGVVFVNGYNYRPPSAFTMTGGTIRDNLNGNSSGIGVYILDFCNFTMSGGIISGNSIGVHVHSNNGTFTMSGGEISSNNTGVNVRNTAGTFIMNDGEISSNNTGVNGDINISSGVIKNNIQYGVANGNITISGNATIIDDIRLSFYIDFAPGNIYYRSIFIGSNWTGNITGKLNLAGEGYFFQNGIYHSYNDDLGNIINFWIFNDFSPILRAVTGHTLTTSDVGKFTLGDFIYGNNAQPISQGGVFEGSLNTEKIEAPTGFMLGPILDNKVRLVINTSTTPSEPRNFTAEPGNSQVTLSWTAPYSNGSSAITGYQVRIDSSAWVPASSNTGHTFTGLTNGTDYTFQVRAVNAAGNGSAASVTATPFASLTFIDVTANGSSISTTTQLTLTFSQAIPGLHVNDITLSGVSGVTKGELIGYGPTYTLNISGVSSNGTLSVAVAKTGFTISNSLRTLNIFAGAPNNHVFNVANNNDWNLAWFGIHNSGNNKTYTINVTANFRLGDISSHSRSATNVTVTIQGNGNTSISNHLNPPTGISGYLPPILTIGSGDHIILKDISLIGTNPQNINENVLIQVIGGIFTMQGSASIKGGQQYGVQVSEGGEFIMKDSASVNNNDIGVLSSYSGTFRMQDNSSVHSNGRNIGLGSGGGVVVNGGNFTMQGNASIYNNKQTYNLGGAGGGVSIHNGGTFTKTGGTIYGSGAGANSNTTSTNRGHAIYDSSTSPARWRNSTAGTTENTSSSNFWLND